MIESYTVLARKYRPQNFDQVVGQNVLIRVISNAIKANRIHHSFILTGTRGIGKTTIARILAKVFNCENPIVSLNKNIGTDIVNPCNVCESCKAILDGNHQDVFEIDAASNTGVADVREIIENSRYLPIVSKYKVYIIDEFHMLSNSAFNALLKLLEEPPPHVKFIFATTEIKKIPATILSRSQRFDLRCLSIEELESRFIEILKQENISFEENAIKLLAKAAKGSARDGLSLLDKLISMDPLNVSESNFKQMLGYADDDIVLAILDNILLGNVQEALATFDLLQNKGSDVSVILESLMNYVNERTIQLSMEVDKSDLLISLMRVWQMLLKGLEELRYTYDQNATMQMLIIRVCYMNSMITPEEILSTVEIPKEKETISSTPDKPQKFTNTYNTLINTVDDLLNLCQKKHKLLLFHYIRNNIKILEIKHSQIKFELLKQDKTIDLSKELLDLTGIKWSITILEKSDESLSMIDEKKMGILKKEEEIKNEEIVKKIFDNFGSLEVSEIKINND